MSLFILDTDIFSMYESLDSKVLGNVLNHLADRLAVSTVTIEEQLQGWQTRINRARTDLELAAAHERMKQTIEFMHGWAIVPLTVPSVIRYKSLLRSRLNVRRNDLRLGAIALEAGGIVVTRNLRDFRRIPGLICEDWSV